MFLAGDTDVFFASISDVQSAYQSGEMKIACVFSEERSDFMPDVPDVYKRQEHTLIVVPNNILDEYFSEEEQGGLREKKLLPIQVFARCPFIKMKHSNWIGRNGDGDSVSKNRALRREQICFTPVSYTHLKYG